MTDAEQPDPVLRAVREHWAEIEERASPQQRERLRGLAGGTPSADPALARAELGDLLLDLLPPDHPVIRLLRARPMLKGAQAAVPAALPDSAPLAARLLPVTIYLADEAAHAQVEMAVEWLLASAGLVVEVRDDPVLGSWFRRLAARARAAAESPAARDIALSAAHALDVRLLQARDAEVTARLLQNLPPLVGALQPAKDAVVRLGALLVVKAEWSVSIFQLTAAQQARLDHSPRLACSPQDVVAALSLGTAERRAVPAAALDLYVEEPVLGERDSRFLRETGVSFGQPRLAMVPDDELPPSILRLPQLPQLRLTEVTLPFDLEEPPDGCRYTAATVRMTFDSQDVLSLELRVPPGGTGHPDDSVPATWGAGRQQLTWKLTARNEESGLRPSGREVLVLLGSPLAVEKLTGTLDASVSFTRRVLGHSRRSTAQPRTPLRFALNVADGTFEAGPDGAGYPGP